MANLAQRTALAKRYEFLRQIVNLFTKAVLNRLLIAFCRLAVCTSIHDMLIFLTSLFTNLSFKQFIFKMFVMKQPC